MNCGRGVGIRLRHITFVFISLTVLLFLISTTAAAQQCPLGQFPCFTAKPLIDGNATLRYKGQYNVNMYGDYSHGYGLSTQEPGPNPLKHDADGVARAAGIKKLCRSGSETACDPGETPKIVVVALGFSNWTKEVCGDQFAQVCLRGFGDVDHESGSPA